MRIRLPKKSKYRAVRTTVGGVTFASKKEAARYVMLKAMEQAGEISDLELQPSYPLKVNGVLICTYRGDFRYREKDGTVVVNDVKGFLTPAYRIKKKLMKALYSIEILET